MHIYIVLHTARNTATAKLLLELVNYCDNISENNGKIKMASILKQLEIEPNYMHPNSMKLLT